MEKIAIIPARGGSKRLPRKNILPLQDKPLICYPIAAALESNLFDRVIVSTEDKEIAKVAEKYHASVMRRPKSLSQDTSTVVQVCMHVLKELEKDEERPPYFCCIYATAVFICPSDLTGAFQLLNVKPKADFVMGISGFNLQPFQALVKKDGFLSPFFQEKVHMQSQKQPELVASNGTIYWARSSEFIKQKTFYGKRLRGYPIDRFRAVDVDTPEDYKIVKKIASLWLCQ